MTELQTSLLLGITRNSQNYVYLCTPEFAVSDFVKTRSEVYYKSQRSIDFLRYPFKGGSMTGYRAGAGRSSEVERSLMVRWVVGSILHGVDPLSYFSFQPVLHDWCTKGRGYVLFCLWDGAYKSTLAVNR